MHRKKQPFRRIFQLLDYPVTIRGRQLLLERRLEVFEKDLLSEVALGAVSLDGTFQIRAGSGGRLQLPEALFQILIVIPDAEEIHEQSERLEPLIILHFDADSHQWLADFIQGLASALIGLDVALFPEVLKLAGDGLRGGEESLGDLFDRHGAFTNTKIFDDLPLHRWQPTDALLVVGREFVHHFHERLQKRIDTVAGDELGEDDVDAVIAPRKMMDRPDSGAPPAGGEEFYDAAFFLKSGDVLKEFGRLLDIERLEMFCLKKAEKGTGPAR